MRPSTVTANATTTAVNITGSTLSLVQPSPTSNGAPIYFAKLTYSGAALPLNSWVAVAGVTPSTFNGTWLVIESGSGYAILCYRTTNPGTWGSGGTITTSAASPMVALDRNSSPFNVALGCIATGTVTFTVQHTFDDIFDLAVNPTWIDQPASGINGKTANTDGNYAYPVAATRVNTTAGTGSVAMTVRQGLAI